MTISSVNVLIKISTLIIIQKQCKNVVKFSPLLIIDKLLNMLINKNKL